MKSISEMTRLEFAAFVATELRKQNIRVVLSGGSCVSIYSADKYVSMDLDFIDDGFVKRSQIVRCMISLGFTEQHRYFRHPDTDLLVEFPAGPLGIGDEPITQVSEIETSTGVLRLLSPTDSVKDRLAWFYHTGDTECLEQVVLIAGLNRINIKEVERWSVKEGKAEDFNRIRIRLEGIKTQRK